MRGPQFVKKGVWYLGGRKKKRVVRKKKQKKDNTVKDFHQDLASVGVPFFGEIAKPVIKKIFGRGKRRYRQWEKKILLGQRVAPKSYAT